MKSRKSLSLLLLVTISFIYGCQREEVLFQEPILADGTRFKDLVFSEVTSERDVKYGQNKSAAGREVDLFMNIYQPAKDTMLVRPLVILAHGGGFTSGQKEDFDDMAQAFAQAGYVAATISYRLMDEGGLKTAVVDAVQDLMAAIRYFTKDNAYRVDEDNVWVGGFSAGAVMALHAAYFRENELASAPQEIVDHLNATGGFSGNSGNPGASEKIKGVINIAGGLFRADWVSAGEPRLVSVHGTRDKDVAYTKDPAAANNPNGDFTEGSGLIHPIADRVGIVNQLKAIERGKHGAFFTCSECFAEIRNFMYNNL
ncbi:MAG: alpha/beta hydrolase [Bacteroidota bacterium]